MRKIAIVTDGWRRFVNYSWVFGCRKYIEEHKLDAEIDVFQCFGNISKDEQNNIGEYNIINLPDLTEYDGIILEITNILLKEQYNNIVQKVIDSKVPAVSLFNKIPGMYRSGVDNYGSMRTIVEHLIVKHGCRKINFVGGPVENYENNSRRRAYEDVLREYGISVEPQRIFQRNYEVDTGMIAFDHFKEMGEMPDAFVCANENIAVGLCQQAMDAGYRVPEDFCITAFDDFDKASYFEPPITTVGYSRDDIAYEAVRLLHRIWQGEEVPQIVYADAYHVFQDSCGCRNNNHKKRSDYLKDNIFSEVRQIDLYNETMDMNRSLFECKTYEQMAEYLAKCLHGLRCKEMYLVMNHDIVMAQQKDASDEEDEEKIISGYPEKMDVVIAYKDGDKRFGITKNPDELLPEIWERKVGDVRMFVPLHMREREVGYFVLVNCDYMMENQFIFETLSSFSKSFEYLYGKNELQRANEKLSILYLQDSLTGLYNRMAYNQLAIPLFNRCMADGKPLAVVFMDADHLKMVNDQYGHDMGNVIISGVADAIKKCFPDDSVAMRYGGDEFVVLVPDCDAEKAAKLSRRFHDTLRAMTRTKQLQFKIEASSGYVIAENDSKSIDEYINEADDKMYKAKKRRKAQRE